MWSFEWWTIILAGISTIAIFSFLYKENPFYRFFEHLFIGIATGITFMLTIKNLLWPQAIKPLFNLDAIPFPDGTYPEPYDNYTLLLLIPMVFGSFYYFILTKKLNWLAQLVIGFSLGVGGGLAFKATFNEMLPQLFDSFKPLFVPGDWRETVTNIVFVFTLVTSLSYFFFTFKRRPGGVVEVSSKLGRWMMMVCFGAFFGSTIMARMALLVERLNFLIESWWVNIAVF